MSNRKSSQTYHKECEWFVFRGTNAWYMCSLLYDCRNFPVRTDCQPNDLYSRGNLNLILFCSVEKHLAIFSIEHIHAFTQQTPSGKSARNSAVRVMFFFGFVSLSFCCTITLLYFSICLTTETERKNVEYFVLWLLFGFQSATTPLQTNDICLDSNRWASRISGFCCFVFGSVIVVLSKWLIIYTNICQAFIEICLVWNISGV